MKGETRYLEETLGLSTRLIEGQGIKKIHIESTDGSAYTLDLKNVSPGDISTTIKELCENDEALKEHLGSRTLRIEHIVDDKTGDREMKIAVTPITHVFKRRDDIKEGLSKRKWKIAVVGHPIRPSFKEVLQSHIEAAKASVNKSDEVK